VQILELAPVDLRLAISSEGGRYMAIGAKVHFNTGVKEGGKLRWQPIWARPVSMSLAM
jgi:hypothetical protein